MATLCRTSLLKTIISNNVASSNIPPVVAMQKRGMYGKSMRVMVKIPPQQKPFPYLEKEMKVWHTWMDRTSARLAHPNAKVICVEGSVASGKTAVAKKLAEEFDLKHFPELNMDVVYIDRYGRNQRDLDHLAPDSCRTYDHVKFCTNPFHPTASSYQLNMMIIRFMQYVDALAHMLNSGQGVVLERSPFSDFVFIEAMNKCGFASDGAKSVYNDQRKNSITELLRPHLVLYLDVPVNVIQDRIKARNYPHEQNSKALTDEYLTALEMAYKTKYLKDIGVHSELLVYDWTEPGDMDIVVEDMERIDFDKYTHHDKKLSDWNFINDQDMSDHRLYFTNDRQQFLTFFCVPRFDVPEMIIPGEDVVEMERILGERPGQYAYGFNADMGDTNLLFNDKRLLRDDKYSTF
ncbi:NADH dehydrogenase (ubiquinone) subunit ND-42 [Arctopsyche grandis]|uniref:NADH dehydrogenase (ubiquinone) subunit ND-42 n=1 Tax=Arctopsyche grandis TaxID=121162 RepID=UPI00406D7EA3